MDGIGTPAATSRPRAGLDEDDLEVDTIPGECGGSGRAGQRGERMEAKEYHQVRKLRRELAKSGVSAEVTAVIMEGRGAVYDNSSTGEKSHWMAEAMRRMDSLLDYETRRRVREGCSCCLGGKRREAMRAVAKEGGSIEERLEAVERAQIVPYVRLQPDGRIVARFGPEGPATFDCPCLRQAEERISLTYCQCCGGHVRRHLQTALERKLSCEVVSSILNSGGREVCTFLLTVED